MFHDGCTAGPLSEWLNGTIRLCCDAHDTALDHSTDIWTFIQANIAFGECIAQHAGIALALVLAGIVSGPIGWLLYQFGPKRKADEP
jgi:hypothetical protein